jgi:bleomycin hydrolase
MHIAYSQKQLIMKTKSVIFILLFFSCFVVNGQNIKPERLRGSWIGDIILPENSSIRVLLKFYVKDNLILGSLDIPDQSAKDIYIDSVRISNDSIITDHSSTLGGGAVFKGSMLPGDSIIDGMWMQSGGSYPLKLKTTTYVFVPTPKKTHFNPKLDGYTIVKLIESTPIKDQQQTGLCWCFATTSFIETEAIRLGKNPVEISPMFFVIPTDIDKAEKYIRMNGKSYFGAGDLTFSALKAYKNFGAVPQTVFSGKKDSSSTYNHGMMDYRLLERVKDYVKSGRGNMTAEGYRKKIASIISGTLGEAPASFVYNNKNYTPKSFAEEMIGINPDDYVEITSYNHHPFYSKFILEIESNWNNNYYLNLPINDFSNVVDYALMHNYSVCWDGDIREGYKNGFAVLNDSVNMITQQRRQTAFDNYTTIDQHNMHIVGIAKNDKGKEFYILKNSSDFLDCGGYLYMSKEYFLLKTISVMTNKNGLSKEIMKKVIPGV